ncbi:unnamed protein product [Ilex paraguariensis]|uniref:Uncharacterized protein n=1 Tax=Ilex paraguariensis TaxID=185542 RepID=A0ABC8RDD1_9AQUA
MPGGGRVVRLDLDQDQPSLTFQYKEGVHLWGKQSEFPGASVRANPKIAYPNDCLANDGFRATEWIKELNTFPMPTAAPAKAIVAAPAPIDLAPYNISSCESSSSFIMSGTPVPYILAP